MSEGGYGNSRTSYVIYPDEAAWEDFTEAWQDKIVDPEYFNEE